MKFNNRFTRRKFFRYGLVTAAGIGLSGINLGFQKVFDNQGSRLIDTKDNQHDLSNLKRIGKHNYSDNYIVSPNLEPKLLHRFVVIGDPHYGEFSRSSTDVIGLDERTGPAVEPIGYDETAQDMVDALITEKKGRGLNFFIVNGDVQRREEEFRDKYLNKVGVPFYVTNGNHDRWSDDESQNLWGHPLNHVFTFGNYACILLDTSGDTGARQVCLGDEFLETALKEHENKKGIFLVCHIARFARGFRENPNHEAPQCDTTMQLLKTSSNFVCGVHSHFHEEIRVIYEDGMPFCFTGRYGGSYGINFYGYRIFELYDNGAVRTMLYNHTDDEIVVLAHDPTTFI